MAMQLPLSPSPHLCMDASMDQEGTKLCTSQTNATQRDMYAMLRAKPPNARLTQLTLTVTQLALVFLSQSLHLARTPRTDPIEWKFSIVKEKKILHMTWLLHTRAKVREIFIFFSFPSSLFLAGLVPGQPSSTYLNESHYRSLVQSDAARPDPDSGPL